MFCRANEHCFSIATYILATVTIALTTSLDAGERTKVSIKSTADGTDQPCYVILPDGCDAGG